jgi:hypothetical protein
MHYLKLRATMLGGEMVHGGQSGYFVVRLRLSETPARTTSVSASLPVLDCQHLGESTLTHRAASAVTPAHALGGYIPSGTFFRIGEDLDLDRPLGGADHRCGLQVEGQEEDQQAHSNCRSRDPSLSDGQAYLHDLFSLLLAQPCPPRTAR